MKLKLVINPYKMFVTYIYTAPCEEKDKNSYSYEQVGFVLRLLPEDEADRLIESGWDLVKEMRLPKFIYKLFKDPIVEQEAKLLINNKNRSQQWLSKSLKMQWDSSLSQCSSTPSSECSLKN